MQISLHLSFWQAKTRFCENGSFIFSSNTEQTLIKDTSRLIWQRLVEVQEIPTTFERHFAYLSTILLRTYIMLLLDLSNMT